MPISISINNNFRIFEPNRSIKFSCENIANFVINNFLFQMNSQTNRNRIIFDLNRIFFPDNIAEFVDVSSAEDIHRGQISIMILYKGVMYNILAFEEKYLKIERMRKLNKLKYGY